MSGRARSPAKLPSAGSRHVGGVSPRNATRPVGGGSSPRASAGGGGHSGGDVPPEARVRVAVRIRPSNMADNGDTTRAVWPLAALLAWVEGDTRHGIVEMNSPKDGLNRKMVPLRTLPAGIVAAHAVFDHVFTGDQVESPRGFASMDQSPCPSAHPRESGSTRENTLQPARVLQVYSTLGETFLQDAFAGYNVCLFAYGQTGSGKTHSMLGDLTQGVDGDQAGLLPRLTQRLFGIIDEKQRRDNNLEITVKCSFLEIYLEEVYDLLGKGSRPLNVVEDIGNKCWTVRDLTHVGTSSPERIMRMLLTGSGNRKKDSTNMNEHSSRSHALFTISITLTHATMGSGKTSKIIVVDLAGSERQSKTGDDPTVKRQDEAKNINLSLTYLQRCLKAAQETGGNTHIPVRDSILTRLISDVFGGNARSTMFATVSPATFNFQESLYTLQYAEEAKKIRHSAKINVLRAKAEEVKGYRDQIDELQKLLKYESDKMQGRGTADEKEGADLDRQYKDLQRTLRKEDEENGKLKEHLVNAEAINKELRKGLVPAGDAHKFSHVGAPQPPAAQAPAPSRTSRPSRR
eukprot:gene7017-1254_t